jgi:hypothetical protein
MHEFLIKFLPDAQCFDAGAFWAVEAVKYVALVTAVGGRFKQAAHPNNV